MRKSGLCFMTRFWNVGRRRLGSLASMGNRRVLKSVRCRSCFRQAARVPLRLVRHEGIEAKPCAVVCKTCKLQLRPKAGQHRPRRQRRQRLCSKCAAKAAVICPRGPKGHIQSVEMPCKFACEGVFCFRLPGSAWKTQSMRCLRRRPRFCGPLLQRC